MLLKITIDKENRVAFTKLYQWYTKHIFTDASYSELKKEIDEDKGVVIRPALDFYSSSALSDLLLTVPTVTITNGEN